MVWNFNIIYVYYNPNYSKKLIKLNKQWPNLTQKQFFHNAIKTFKI